MVIKHNPVFIAEGLLGDPMKLFCRHRAVIVHFTVYVFRLPGQFKPGKIRGTNLAWFELTGQAEDIDREDSWQHSDN